ncbi:MAG: hypothetical protein U0V75_00190 [Ferruginibacter sp.]
MILKSLSRKSDSTGQLVRYITRYILKEQKDGKSSSTEKLEQANKPFLIRHNLRTRTSIEGFIREFQENEKYRRVKRRDSVRLYHTIISLSNLDKEFVTEVMLKDIGKEFIRLRGKDSLYLGTMHQEGVDHLHIHFVISGTKTNGLSSRITKEKFASIKRHLQQYQQEMYPELINSSPEHGKKKRLAKEHLIDCIKKYRQTNKKELLNKLETIYSQSPTKEAFIQQIKDAGYEVYMRGGRLQGVQIENKKFRFSRLGFDEERLRQLDEKVNNEAVMLTELQQLREQKSQLKNRQTNQEIAPVPENGLTNTERTQLEELQAVRSTESRSLEKEEEGFERTLETRSQSKGESNADFGGDETSEIIPGLFQHLLKPVRNNS